jgi:hypothetical protein
MPTHTDKPSGYKSTNASMMKPLDKPRKQLTKLQTEFMKEHSKKHSAAHNKEMRRLMKLGHCIQIAHSIAMKTVGK